MANGQVTIIKRDAGGAVIFTRTGFAFVQMETADLHLGHTNVAKYIDAVRLDIYDLRGSSFPTVEVGYRDNLSQDITWLSEQTLAEGTQMVYLRVTAKLFRIRVNLKTNDGFFVLSGLEFFGAAAGRRTV